MPLQPSHRVSHTWPRPFPRALLATVLLAAGAAGAADSGSDWIRREKIRAGWIYAKDGVERLAFFKNHGMNALITHAGNPESFTLWAQAARRADMRLVGVVGASFDGAAAGMRRCVFANGYESVVPCPQEERYWREVLTETACRVARESLEPDRLIAGVLIDWELYANSRLGGQIYFTDACFCDHCWNSFLQDKGRAAEAAAPAPGERLSWLKAQGLAEDYQARLQERVRDQARAMRAAVSAVRPGFLLGFYPVPHNWHLRGVAQGLGNPDEPVVLWATSTYGGGGPGAIADTWKQDLLDQGIHAFYCGGMLLRQYSAANLAANLVEIARKTDGYWLFTVHTLCIKEEDQRGDYHLCAGTPEEYLAAIRRGNAELDAFAADPAHASSLAFVEEPVRYRHPGFDIGRLELPDLADRSTAGRGQALAMPPLGIIASSYLLMAMQDGEEATLTLDVSRPKSGAAWGVSYAVLGPDKAILSDGRMPPGEAFTLAFQARQAGLHTVVITPGYYGRCQVLTSTVPYAHWTWRSYPAFEVAGPGGTLYVHVPAGLTEFDLEVSCLSATAQVQVTVRDPAGRAVVDQPTDALVRKAALTIPTAGQDGQLWSIRLGRVEGKSYRSAQVLFDPRLPPAVSTRPDVIFTRP